MTFCKKLSGCILILLLAVACTTKQATIKGNPNSWQQQGRVQFETSNLEHFIDVEDVDPTQRIGSGLMKLVVTFRNRTAENVWVEIRTTFLDSQKHRLEQTNWEPIMLDARTITEYTCTSMGNQAADYQIIIRRPKK